jgi:hypothetical protein
LSRSTSNLFKGLRSDRKLEKLQNEPIITDDQIKQEMVDAFAKVKLDLYTDILRIKKP